MAQPTFQLPKHKLLEEHEVLVGGVVSSVKAGTLTDKKTAATHPIVIKHTHSKVVGGPQFSHSDKEFIRKMPQTHSLDIDVLRLLQNDPDVRVPELHYTSKQHKLTIMADFRAHGYALMQDLLVKNQLPLESAASYGRMLGHLQRRFAAEPFTGLKAVEQSIPQVRERLQEIHVLSYDNLDVYRALEAKLLEPDGLIYTDGHPKNIAVNASGEVMIFDFGRSIIGSRQFPVPNFAAHIGLAALGGCIAVEFGLRYMKEFIDAYQSILPIEEEWFVKFFVGEVLHRGLALRWIDKRLAASLHPGELKIASYMLYLNVCKTDQPVRTIDELFCILEKIASSVAAGQIKDVIVVA